MLARLGSLVLCAFQLGLAFTIASPRPLVLWHGLGDSHASRGMLDFQDLIKEVHPGIFIHSVWVHEDANKDRDAGFYGNVDVQLDVVFRQLSSVPELEHGFDAIGFSQGESSGMFLRAYVERYNYPRTYNLITFGSQHLGIADIPECGTYDFLCKSARRIILSAVYGKWAQENLIQASFSRTMAHQTDVQSKAQYFRDPTRYNDYLVANMFLTDINNEIPGQRNATYQENLKSLENLVLIIFSEDKTVIPKESAWFGYDEITDDAVIVPMRQQPIYTEDWIGLKELDETGRIVFGVCEGEHMQLNGCWREYVERYVGSVV
ncbi:Alpha/Beta hydrolase protein [Schizophyllum fasciatum]